MTDVMIHQKKDTEHVRLTQSAKEHILNYLSKQSDVKGIRFSVKKSGCSGLSYVVDYVVAPLEDDLQFPLEDPYLICIDYKSFSHLKGIEVDYVKQGLNYKFSFKNPNQTGLCGCGESFTTQDQIKT